MAYPPVFQQYFTRHTQRLIRHYVNLLKVRHNPFRGKIFLPQGVISVRQLKALNQVMQSSVSRLVPTASWQASGSLKLVLSHCNQVNSWLKSEVCIRPIFSD